MEFESYGLDKILPAPIVDFVLKDRYHGIISLEFQAAIERGDVKNIMEGIDSVIMNSQTKTRIKLSEADYARMNIIAQNEIVKKLLATAV